MEGCACLEHKIDFTFYKASKVKEAKLLWIWRRLHHENGAEDSPAVMNVWPGFLGIPSGSVILSRWSLPLKPPLKCKVEPMMTFTFILKWKFTASHWMSSGFTFSSLSSHMSDLTLCRRSPWWSVVWESQSTAHTSCQVCADRLSDVEL